MSRFDYTRQAPLGSIDNALVFATANGTYDVYMPPHRPSRTQAATRRYTSAYELDIGIHLIRESISLPSADDAFHFDGSVEIAWQVIDPVRYVSSGERDVPQRLLSELEIVARPITRRIPIENSGDAEVELQRAMSASGPIGKSIGLRVSWNIKVIQEKRSLQLSAMVNERISQFEREMLYEKQQEDDRHIEIQKAAFYQYQLDNGDVTSWAHHLARHPEDSRLIMDTLRQDQRQRDIVRRQLPQIAKALQTDSAISEMSEENRNALIQAIQEGLNQSSVGN
ncbi:hypothetical protein [Streptomyces mirabilis]|uniref:hypothetical protein n=1 Tax=Streptomyces mirabilis TaxID=68239 RepID=UPI0036BCD445